MKRFEHHAAHLDRAAIAVVVDEQNRVLMMWRHPFLSDRWGWELPGGLVDAGEDAITTAAREVEEETGYRPKEIEHLITYQPIFLLGHACGKQRRVLVCSGTS
ncbi:NUDIX hydrolase [Streptosporangium lutulentum]|uniref:8-oxo-dGTP pyrophosphatase MutT (NUDIX family) n=1 Tax=Streptosporangium lutulentum TaxID=1461250 RepID=A0ABT9QK70_9ACTN|nr:NUDIX hydrolase [Streptosporangium lutulentum]MDP9847155.1 8-oxo-dGTP pyrophosphatase MutT (NUDIX family) [Streptosporangium lutulentum]